MDMVYWVHVLVRGGGQGFHGSLLNYRNAFKCFIETSKLRVVVQYIQNKMGVHLTPHEIHPWFYL